jgi:hypothetical protein
MANARIVSRFIRKGAAMRTRPVGGWPRAFHNMRASLATELANQFPSHVCASWLGHSEAIADQYYRMTLEEHFAKATQKSDASGSVFIRREPSAIVAFPGISQGTPFSSGNTPLSVIPPGCEGTPPPP